MNEADRTLARLSVRNPPQEDATFFTLKELNEEIENARNRLEEQDLSPGNREYYNDAIKRAEDSKEIIKADHPYYVIMKDPFFSNFGHAGPNKNAVYVYPVDSREEANIVAENAENRGDQTYIRIVDERPMIPLKANFVKYVTRIQAPIWFKKGSFNKVSKKKH